MNLFENILVALGLMKKKPKHGKNINLSRCYGNANSAIHKVKTNTHPKYKDDNGRAYAVEAGTMRVIGGGWAKQSPEHNNAWIMGLYDPSKRRCMVFCNPNDPNDYSDAVQEHEVAHDIEKRLKIAPPWHTPLWSNLFYNWWSLKSGRVMIDTWNECVDYVNEDDLINE